MVMCCEVMCLAEEGDRDNSLSFQVGISATSMPGTAVSMQSIEILNLVH